MTRTFIALEMNESLQRHLGGVIRQVARGMPTARWVDPVGIHLTLAFLGELTEMQLAEAIQAAETIARDARPFFYHLSRLGLFGTMHHPHVIWVGIEESSGALLQLHRVLNDELEQRGFELDKRPFSPHLTLARVKAPLTLDEQQWFQDILTGEQREIVSTEVYPVQYIQVMKSELFNTGAHYTCLRQCRLECST